MNFDTIVATYSVDPKRAEILKNFYHSYHRAAQDNGVAESVAREHFVSLIKFIALETEQAFQFEPFHKAIVSPIDYYTFGVEFMKVLVKGAPLIKGQDNLRKINDALERGENVVLFANHQSEADPQFISCALEKDYPRLAKEMIFVAGERVVTDPLAIPFSKGRNLLCIYSKRYIDFPPEQKLQKQLHNKKTMEQMAELLKQGGKIIYVAPSGGRDRRDENGQVKVAPFDSQSLEMFLLMAKKAGTTTHFHTLALSTYDLLPPPEGIQKELGEQRNCQAAKIGFYFGDLIDLEKYAHLGDKHIIRQERAKDLTETVEKHYQSLL